MKKLGVEGFTLVELGVGIVLVGILLVIALPPFHSFYRGLQLEESAGKIRGDLVLSQQRAVATHSTLKFSLLPGNQGYQIRNVGENSVFIAQTLPSSLTFDESSDPEITFYHNGNTTGGRIRLKNKEDSRQCEIGVAMTGHVVVNPRGW